MRDDDLISIIVPMYNVEKYVEKCLMSLIKQTYKNIKILAISDGSLDKSYEIALEISKKDKRMQILSVGISILCIVIIVKYILFLIWI